MIYLVYSSKWWTESKTDLLRRVNKFIHSFQKQITTLLVIFFAFHCLKRYSSNSALKIRYGLLEQLKREKLAEWMHMNSVPYILNILYTILFSFFLHCLHDFCISTDAGFLHESFPTKINILTAISSQRNHIVQFFYMYTAVFESPRSLDWPFLIKINYKHSTFTPHHFSCCFRRNNVCTAFPASVNFAMLTFLKLNQFCQAIFRKPLCTLQPEWEFIMPRCGPLMNNKGQTKTNGTEKTKDLGCIYI